MSGYLPKYGAQGPNPENYFFKSSKIDILSFKTTPFELFAPDGISVSTHATGFHWRKGSVGYVITNRHVVTGRDCFTDGLMPSGFIPRKARVYMCTWEPDPADNTKRRPWRQTTKFDLYDEDGRANWIQHPLFDELRIDLAAIPFCDVEEDQDHSYSPFLNDYSFTELRHDVGSDVTILGYPFRNYAGINPAIWKRGTMASEPSLLVDGKPMFLIDSLSRPGMSGSPVIKRVYGAAQLADGSLSLTPSALTEFIGIYSGRLASLEASDAAIAYAWSADALSQLIEHGSSPTFADVHPGIPF
ncbi:MAG: serine protease [Rhizobiaceae bacterium]